jgi:hypothetical protein
MLYQLSYPLVLNARLPRQVEEDWHPGGYGKMSKEKSKQAVKA